MFSKGRDILLHCGEGKKSSMVEIQLPSLSSEGHQIKVICSRACVHFFRTKGGCTISEAWLPYIGNLAALFLIKVSGQKVRRPHSRALEFLLFPC